MKTTLDRLPPHSVEAEQGVLGCMLLSPNGCIEHSESELGRSGEPFYDLRHRELFETMVTMHERNTPIDLITLNQNLTDRKKLDAIGGLSYISALKDATAGPANLPYYLHILIEKFTLRKLIQSCTETVASAYDTDGDIDTFVTQSQARLISVLKPISRSTTQEHWSVNDLATYDIAKDPNAIVGWHEGKATRYLCRGYGAWLIGQSGIGKSSLGQQQCYLFALGRSFCGITPVRPLRCLIVQNENDQGDCAESTQGILAACEFTPEEFELLNSNVKTIRCRGKTGGAFCSWLAREVSNWQADIVYVDPLLRFAGIDVSRQDQCTKFLNDSLDPVLADTGVVMIGAHHTGKPKSKKETQGWTIYDHAYSGIGSSELVNWARAITLIQVLPHGIFEMLLAKRGNRAWATHPDSTDPTTSIYLQHATDRIFWQQIQPPEDPKPTPSTDRSGRPNKIQEIASSNLFSFCNACPPEPEGKNEIAKRLETWLATERIDASFSTCKRTIEALVANGKLTKTPNGSYVKGPQA